MANKKISLIGAGSGCFSLALVQDFCRSKHLSGCTISLMDVDETRLDAVHELSIRYIRELGAGLQIEKTLDRIESLKGADCVINTALTAPYSRLQEGWGIAEKYGFRFGGSYHVMYDEAFWINFYQLRFMESITQDMLTHCPNAWHLMVANPVIAGTTHLLRKYPGARMLGLCHGYREIYEIASALGLGREGLTYEMPGVNHFVWLRDARVNGQDLFPILDKWIEERGAEVRKTGQEGPLRKSRLDFYRRHGVLGVGDTLRWSGASWPWWYHSDDEVEKSFGEHPPMDGWNGYFNRVAKAAQWIKDIAKDKNTPVSSHFPAGSSYHEMMILLAESLLCDIPRVLIVNILNKGQLVPGIPDDFEVEVPALCSASGVHGIQTTPLPKSVISYILRDRVAPVEMELEAFNTGRRDYLEELVLMDKWATSLKQVHDFVGDIFALPYHKEMRDHYR